MSFRKIIYAPLVNTGGGKKLLFDILSVIDNKNILVFLDFRLKNELNSHSSKNFIFVKNNLLDLFFAECKLYLESHVSTKVFCFHGAPPIFKNPGYVTIFFQNKLNLQICKNFNFLDRFKKHFFVKSFDFCEKIIVQTESMRREIVKFTRDESISKKIEILPFGSFLRKNKNSYRNKKFDFIYVADGYHHKNHENLFSAWIILAENGLFPSLALTLPKSNKVLISLISQLALKYKLNIKNLGTLNKESLIESYLKSRALIYPSLTESFGLPLIEASYLNIPIIASELDFVRDVCKPLETFDPNSPVSISRAIERFLKVKKFSSLIITPSQFVSKVFNENS